MALTNQPYLPLYVDDWMNNTKLKQCSIGAHGLMISIMCIMHKEDTYGKILLKQKFKQTDKQIKNFASYFARTTSFDLLDIEKYLSELIDEKVLVIEGDFLICNRMVKDAQISLLRSGVGKEGGLKTQAKNKGDFAKAKHKANSGIEYGNEIEDEIINEIKEYGVVRNLKTHYLEIKSELMDSILWMEQLQLLTKLSKDVLFRKMEYFFIKEKAKESTESIRGLKSHFVNALNDPKYFQGMPKPKQVSV